MRVSKSLRSRISRTGKSAGSSRCHSSADRPSLEDFLFLGPLRSRIGLRRQHLAHLSFAYGMSVIGGGVL
jgi:hypothetical protein